MLPRRPDELGDAPAKAHSLQGVVHALLNILFIIDMTLNQAVS
jgi:hypothetical protein